jgi:DNA-binding PadR family transcriptional regulator
VSVSLEYKDVENKLLILYLINRMEISMSRAQITDFVMAKDFMNYFTLEQTLSVMLEQGLLEASEENAQDASTTRYAVTNKGLESLDYFVNHIPRPMRGLINQYVIDNRGKVKRDYEVTATYFPNVESNDFQVKCGVYEDRRVILELSISVDTREQAKLIQGNWRNNASGLYQRIIDAVTTDGSP